MIKISDDILSFVRMYEEMIKVNAQTLKDSKKSPLEPRTRRKIKFTVYHTNTMNFGMLSEGSYNILDEEDLKYLYDKNSKLIKKEMQDNIDKINERYDII